MPGILDQDVQVTVGDSTVIVSIVDVYNIAEQELTFANSEPADQIKTTITRGEVKCRFGWNGERFIGLGLARVSLIRDWLRSSLSPA
jgi:hypothetical protein